MTDQESAGTTAMAMVHSPPGYRVIAVEEAEKRFRVSDDIWYPYADFSDEQELNLLHLEWLHEYR